MTIRHKVSLLLQVNKSRYLVSIILAVVFNSVVHLEAQEPDSIQYFIEQYEYQKVIDQIDKIVDHEKIPELIDYKVISLKKLHKYQEALPYLEGLYEKDSSNIQCISDLANCYESLGNYRSAQDLYQQAFTLNPGNSYVIQQLANSCFKMDDFEKALKYYLAAYSRDSTFYLSRQLAKCYESLDSINKAIEFFQVALIFNASDFESTYRLANLYKLKNEYSSGIHLADSYLKQDSTNFKMLRLSGFLHFLNESYDTSIFRFERCIKLGDASDFVSKYLGYSYFKIGEYESAKDYLETAFLKDTLNPDLCYTLGLTCDYSIYKKLGIFYLNKTLELLTPSPEFLSQVYQDLANAYTGYYKYDEALNAYLTAYELTPMDTLLIFKIASHYDNWIKDKEKALIYYQRFMDTRPKNNKSLPKMPGVMVLSYYDFVERRMIEIREEIFWEEK